MTQNQYITLAAAGSAALMIGALAFQHIGGLAPCKMCIWQRYPHVIAIVLGAVIIALGNTKTRLFLIIGGLVSTVVTACIGIYHAGVEQGLFEGPTSCTSGSISGISADDLLAQIMTAPVVRCDEIAWQLAGISMAGWNALLSMMLFGFWIMALKRG